MIAFDVIGWDTTLPDEVQQDKTRLFIFNFTKKEKPMNERKPITPELEKKHDGKTIPEMSYDTKVLIAKLKEIEEGEFISYTDLSETIHKDVQNPKDGYGRLSSARNHLVVKEGILFEVVRNEGLKRLTPTEIVNGKGDQYFKKIRRASRKGVKELRCALNGVLSNEELTKLHTDASILGAIVQCTKEKNQKIIAERARMKATQLPVGETLALMRE